MKIRAALVALTALGAVTAAHPASASTVKKDAFGCARLPYAAPLHLNVLLDSDDTVGKPVPLTLRQCWTSGGDAVTSIAVSWGDGTKTRFKPGQRTVTHTYTSLGTVAANAPYGVFSVKVFMTTAKHRTITQKATADVHPAYNNPCPNGCSEP